MVVFHAQVNIRGVLRWGAVGLRGMFRAVDGRLMSGAEVVDYLLDHLESGHKMLPWGVPCEGWSFLTGCPGHRAEECVIGLDADPPVVLPAKAVAADSSNVVSRYTN